jgi:hypothetical protein
VTPQRFANSNVVVKAPEGMDNCNDVHAWVGQTPDGTACCITAWRPTREELVKLNLGEPLWLWCCGSSMPPVALSTDDPFEPKTTIE